ncbi:MAG: murein L,D-transpeptidase [Myxococcales bacterium]|nr:murein L,D-transpeptidase [Myxococcales bacterium]
MIGRLLLHAVSAVLVVGSIAPSPVPRPDVAARLAAKGSHLGAPVFVRIFKEAAVLEVWAKADARYVLFERYPICRFSGGLGPKRKEGDRQAPEGLYRVGLGQLNPHSRFHLSFDLGYPNAFEAAQGWTGSALMVHGSCVSIGCYAMGDAAITEIYTLMRAALRAGQPFVSVQALPFALTEANLRAHAGSPFLGHWRALAPAYAAFEREHVPPTVSVTTKGYSLP